MQNAPRLLDKIVGLTSLRDVELLEFSLLKTIHGHLYPSKLSLVKLNRRSIPIMQTDFVSGHCEVRYNNIQLQQEVSQAIENLENSNSQSYNSQSDFGHINIYLLQQTNRSRTYLVVISEQAISKLDAYLVSGFVQVHKNFCELLLESQTDELTGLANRKTFEENISKIHEMVFHRDNSYPQDQRGETGNLHWLVMIDVDHFKRVNDNFGHLYGDEVLILIAQLLKESFRDDDYVFRFGGEEFVAIVRTPDRESCEQMLERLRTTVANKDFPGVGKITISIGATEMKPRTFHITLLDYADQALYHSKGNGRNRITFFEDMVRDGQAKFEDVQPGEIDLF
ncbi:MAG: GGDEF domain-containing protein [Candidatus Pelagadaptatus aseana]|uniref:GGDEF domain-containing protein n=1 Tax=Candidatus Pelagadaptatus aseana TaxID=3120508 RepID=UPI0039B19C64